MDAPFPDDPSPYTYIHPEATATLEYRFWKNVTKTESCWLWTGAKWKFGHGGIRVGGKGTPTLRAHHVAYLLAHPDADVDGAMFLHRCDIPACVNPDHIYVGTQADNMRDRAERFRNSDLTPDTVRAIRNSADSISGTAAAFGISRQRVYCIVTGRTYAHVT
jgi:hypothetical protein